MKYFHFDWRALKSSLAKVFSTIIEHWQFVCTIALAGWALFIWNDGNHKRAEDQRLEADRAAKLRAFEVRKPFLERQLALHFEVIHIAGKLAALEVATDEWKQAETRFWGLYWAELAMVADQTVRVGMENFALTLKRFKSEQTEANRSALHNYTRALANAVRGAVDDTWSSKSDFFSNLLALKMGNMIWQKDSLGELKKVDPKKK